VEPQVTSYTATEPLQTPELHSHLALGAPVHSHSGVQPLPPELEEDELLLEELLPLPDELPPVHITGL